MAFEKPYQILFFLLFALLSHSVAAQGYKNVSLGTSLTAVENGSFWASPSGNFAFGFQQTEKSDGFLLAIWFNNIPEKTIVWSAVRDMGDAIISPKGSKVELTSDGSFQLVDPSGKQIWSPSGNGVAHAAMFDTGNFVLVGNQGSQIWWQSFDHPTDTILPGQVLNSPAQLVSRYSQNNFSIGRFLFKLQADGDLVLWKTLYPMKATSSHYWDSKFLGDGFSSLGFNQQEGSIFVQSSNKSIVANISSNAPSTQDFYQRAIMDHDGVFKHLIYPKKRNSSKAWSIYQYIPDNICLAMTEYPGSGACGFNSYCIFNNGIKSCKCPNDYSFIDPNDVMRGCKQDFVPQSCDETSSQAHLFDLSEMQDTHFPRSDYEHLDPVTEDKCRQACLEDCLCALVIFKDGDCLKESLPLKNGRIELSLGGKALLKIRKDNYYSSPLVPENNVVKKDRSKLIIIGSTLLGSSVFLNLLLLVAVCVVVYWLGHNNHKEPKASPFKLSMNLRSFTYDELMEGTNGFTEELGRGAFSTVYKGVLPDIPGNLVAVKRLKMVNESDQEFDAEVSAIGQTHHRNLAKLMGFCREGDHRLLVYEFMSNGTLASFLFDEDQRPSWYQRVEIAIGIAKGLLYLHEECNTQIIHCDIKPQNVLLDDSYTAKISDFGLAKLLKIDQTATITAIRGTKGYVAAEWFRNKPITTKVDVYSFGVLLLELISCRKNFDMNVEDENKMILIDWAYDCFRQRRLDLLVEDDKEAQINMTKVEEYVKISIWCIQEDPSARPTMKQVVQMVEGFMDILNPPDLPSFTSR